MKDRVRKPALYAALYIQVVAGLVVGIAVGYAWPRFAVGFKPLADAFVKLVRMMIAPVVFCTIVTGITGMTDGRAIGRTLLKAFGLFYVLVALALLTGLIGALVVRPGVGLNVDPLRLDASAVTEFARQADPGGFVLFLLRIVPKSYVGALAEGDVLPVLLIAILTGLALTRVGPAGDAVRQLIESTLHMLFAIFGFIIRLSPIAAFGAMAFTVGQYGVRSLSSLALMVATFYGASLAFVVVVVSALARLHGFRIWKLVRYFREELLIILGTSTSDPVLPQLLFKLEKLGCEKRVVGLVLPLAYSFNLTGIAIFLTVATMFIAQACNIHLSGGQIGAMLVVMLLTSKGATGVAGSGFVVLAATLTVVPSVPVAGVALIIGVDRLLSEVRAVTSTIGNVAATIVIAMWEDACDRVALAAALNGECVSTEQVLGEGALAETPPDLVPPVEAKRPA